MDSWRRAASSSSADPCRVRRRPSAAKIGPGLDSLGFLSLSTRFTTILDHDRPQRPSLVSQVLIRFSIILRLTHRRSHTLRDPRLLNPRSTDAPINRPSRNISLEVRFRVAVPANVSSGFPPRGCSGILLPGRGSGSRASPAPWRASGRGHASIRPLCPTPTICRRAGSHREGDFRMMSRKPSIREGLRKGPTAGRWRILLSLTLAAFSLMGTAGVGARDGPGRELEARPKGQGRPRDAGLPRRPLGAPRG